MKKYISLLLAGYLVLNGCSQSSEIETNESSEQNSAAQTEAANPDEVIITAEQAKNLGIILGSPTEQTMGTTLQLSGEVDVPPAGLVSISVPYGGFLRQTDLMPGVHIRKGQVLAVLEHPDYIQIQQDYLDTKTKITLAQQEYARQKELVDEKVAALKNLQQVQAELQLLKNSQAALRQKLLLLNINPDQLNNGKISRTISIYSPINGFVKNVNANIGKMVSATDILFELVNTQDLHIKLNAFEKDVHKLSIGQKFTFQLPNDPKERLAEIMLVGKSVESDKVIPIHAHILDNEVKLLPGMFVTAHIQTGQAKVTALPETAVVQFEGKDYIFVEEQNYQYRRTLVETGIKNRDTIAVNLPPAIKASDKIALKGAHNLLAIQANAEEEE